MQTYPVDIDAVQVVRWMLAESQAAPSRFRILVRRAFEAHELPARKELRLGDEERDDLSEVDTIATLEIAPGHAGDGWLLTVEVEDEAGPRLPQSGRPVEGDEQIDLGGFYREFIASGRGVANVIAQVEDDAAEARLDALLGNIEKNRHGPARVRGARNRRTGPST